MRASWEERVVLSFLALAFVGLPLFGLSMAIFDGRHDGYSYGQIDYLSITSSALPVRRVGQSVDHVIPLETRSDGPYSLELIAGALPSGVWLESASHAIQGTISQAGDYAFTLRVTDEGINPTKSASAEFHWNVGPPAEDATPPR